MAIDLEGFENWLFDIMGELPQYSMAATFMQPWIISRKRHTQLTKFSRSSVETGMDGCEFIN